MPFTPNPPSDGYPAERLLLRLYILHSFLPTEYPAQEHRIFDAKHVFLLRLPLENLLRMNAYGRRQEIKPTAITVLDAPATPATPSPRPLEPLPQFKLLSSR